MKQFFLFYSFCTLFLISCTSGEVNETFPDKTGISIVFNESVESLSASVPPNIPFEQIKEKLTTIIQSENENLYSSGIFNVTNVINIDNSGVEVIYVTPDGQETNFLYFKNIDTSTLTFDDEVYYYL